MQTAALAPAHTQVFNGRIAVTEFIPGLDRPLPISALAAEPSLFSATVEFALQSGGPVTRKIVEHLKDKPAVIRAIDAGLHPVIDVRVQRLMPGMYPSIPGWHCDAVPRGDYHAQPDFSKIHPDAVHFTTLVSTAEDGVSATEFLGTPIEVEFEDHLPVWQQLHRHIEARKDAEQHVIWRARNGEVFQFETLVPHRTTPTTTRGWRLFFRMSLYHNPPLMNGVPSQQQVYLLSEDNGW